MRTTVLRNVFADNFFLSGAFGRFEEDRSGVAPANIADRQAQAQAIANRQLQLQAPQQLLYEVFPALASEISRCKAHRHYSTRGATRGTSRNAGAIENWQENFCPCAALRRPEAAEIFAHGLFRGAPAAEQSSHSRYSAEP